MFRFVAFALLVVFAFQFSPQEACAHFLFAHVVRGAEPRIELHFAESAWDFSSNQRMVDLMAPVKGQIPDGDALVFTSEPSCLTSPLPAGQSVASAGVIYGIMTRGEAFLLQYHAKGVAGLESAAQSTDMDVEILASPANDDRLLLTVMFKGRPAADAEIIVPGAGRMIEQLKTDSRGQVEIDRPRSSLYSFRAMVPEQRSGMHEDKTYDLVRHYTTLTVHAADDVPVASDGLAWAVLHDAYASTNAYHPEASPWNATFRLTSGSDTVQGTLDHDGDRLSVSEDTALTDEHQHQIAMLEALPHPNSLAGRKIRFAADREASAGCTIEVPELRMSFVIRDRNIESINHHLESGSNRTDITEWKNIDGVLLPEQFVVTEFDREGGIITVTMLKRSYMEQDGFQILQNQTGTRIEGRDSEQPLMIKLSKVTFSSD